MMTGSPQCSDIFCATMRAMVSAGPPGGNGTIMRIVRLGYCCALSAAAADHAPASSSASIMRPAVRGMAVRSVEFDADGFDHPTADFGLRADELSKFLRRFAERRLHARGREFVSHTFAVQYGDDFVVQQVDDFGWRFCRRHDALPDAEVKARQCLGDRRNIRRE